MFVRTRRNICFRLSLQTAPACAPSARFQRCDLAAGLTARGGAYARLHAVSEAAE